MSLAYVEKYTVTDYRAWEGDWELIGGNAYAMAPSPDFEHQSVSLKIGRQLDETLESCAWCHAVIEMDVELADDTVVRPDVMVICYEPSARLNRAPDIVFEVISPSTAKRDEILKFDLYRREGVKYYILVYPDGKKAKCYRLQDGEYIKVADFGDELFRFELEKCAIDFDFGFIWKRKNTPSSSSANETR